MIFHEKRRYINHQNIITIIKHLRGLTSIYISQLCTTEFLTINQKVLCTATYWNLQKLLPGKIKKENITAFQFSKRNRQHERWSVHNTYWKYNPKNAQGYETRNYFNKFFIPHTKLDSLIITPKATIEKQYCGSYVVADVNKHSCMQLKHSAVRERTWQLQNIIR